MSRLISLSLLRRLVEICLHLRHQPILMAISIPKAVVVMKQSIFELDMVKEIPDDKMLYTEAFAQ